MPATAPAAHAPTVPAVSEAELDRMAKSRLEKHFNGDPAAVDECSALFKVGLPTLRR